MSIYNDYYCSFVNLDHRTDRLSHITKQLDRVGMPVIRQRGYKPEELKHEKGILTMMKRTPGAVGCHFSQVEIMHKALNRDKHALVMEDDIIFCEDFEKRFSLFHGFLGRTDWDVFWLGGTFHSPAFWHPKGRSKMTPDCSARLGKDCEVYEDRFMRTYGAFCTYAYIVNKNSIDKILDLFDKHLHESIGIDWLFIKLQPQLNCFAFVPGSVKQMDNQSDIGEGMTVFSGFSRLNGTIENSKYWYQERIEDFNHKEWTWR